MELKKIFFDCEVFKHDWLFCFYIEPTNEKITIHNDSLKLFDFIVRHQKNHCFIGFNNKFYDELILAMIFLGLDVYELSKKLITMKDNFHFSPEYKQIKKFNEQLGLYSYDLMNTLRTRQSLKNIEAHFGARIFESPISFEYDKKLNPEQLKEVTEYCFYDVLFTKKLFEEIEKKSSLFQVRKTLIDYYKLPYSMLKNTTNQIIEFAFSKNNVSESPKTYKYIVPEKLKNTNKQILDFYTNLLLHKPSKGNEVDSEQKNFISNGMEVTLGIGGGHGAKQKFNCDFNSENNIFVSLDFDSFYPSMMNEFGFYSKGLKENIIPIWLGHKRTEQEKYLKSMWKILLNSLYGIMGSNFGSKLEDWVNCRNVCISGQIILCDLIEQLKNLNVIQLNTDGIYIICSKKDFEQVDSVIKKMFEHLHLILKKDLITQGKIWQKDVNNYVLFNEKDKSIKVKGRDVKYYDNQLVTNTNGTLSINRDVTISALAIVNYLLFNIPITQTIYDNKNDLSKFMFIIDRKGANFTKTFYGDKEVQKVNRCFASTNTNLDSFTKEKLGVKHKIPNCPKHCFVWNDDIEKLDYKDINLNLDWYVKYTETILNRFLENVIPTTK